MARTRTLRWAWAAGLMAGLLGCSGETELASAVQATATMLLVATRVTAAGGQLLLRYQPLLQIGRVTDCSHCFYLSRRSQRFATRVHPRMLNMWQRSCRST